MRLDSVVCWKWKPPAGYRSTFGPETVNVLHRMVARHYPEPHRFICVTDDPAGINADVEIVQLMNDFAEVPSPHGGRNPSCYRRLRMFHPDIAQVFGERFVSIDLDCVVTGDLRPLWNRDEDFVAWGDTNPLPGSYYNGSMILLTAGARPQVWTEFDPLTSPMRSKSAGCFGSDQGWISFILGAGEARWNRGDGVHSFRNEVSALGRLPENAKLVFFHGAQDPWGAYAQQLPWVKEWYR